MTINSGAGRAVTTGCVLRKADPVPERSAGKLAKATASGRVCSMRFGLEKLQTMIWRPSWSRHGDRMSNRWSRQPYMIWSVAVARQRIGNASPRPLRKLGHARSSRRSSGHVLIGLTSALVSAPPNLGLCSSWRSHPPMVSWEGCTRRAVVWAVACARRTSRSEALSLGSYGLSPSDRLPPWS